MAKATHARYREGPVRPRMRRTLGLAFCQPTTVSLFCFFMLLPPTFTYNQSAHEREREGEREFCLEVEILCA